MRRPPCHFAVTPCGRPTIVTSRPGSSSALGHALGVGERDGVDQGGAALDIVDAEIVELHG